MGTRTIDLTPENKLEIELAAVYSALFKNTFSKDSPYWLVKPNRELINVVTEDAKEFLRKFGLETRILMNEDVVCLTIWDETYDNVIFLNTPRVNRSRSNVIQFPTAINSC